MGTAGGNRIGPPVSRKGATSPHVIDILRRFDGPERRILCVGCGSNQYAGSVRGRHIGLDLPGTPYLAEYPVDVWGDGQVLPFRSGCMGLVYMVGVLCLVRSVGAVLSECYRVLDSTGVLAVIDYNLATTRRMWAGAAGQYHTNVWSPRDLAGNVSRAGFEAKVVWDCGPVPSAAWQRALVRPRWAGCLLRRLKCYVGESWSIVVGFKG